MPMLNTYNLNKLFSQSNISEYDENDIQAILAMPLRQQAISHLRDGKGPVAKAFRGEYSATSTDRYQDFLDKQSKNGTWGTYIEAAALGEFLGCTVVVTPVKAGKEQQPICLYNAGKNTSTVHLYNSDNTHWYVNNKTKGDGNCLYNAFAQALRKIVAPKSYVAKSHFLTKEKERAVIAHQQKIAAAIKRQPEPEKLEKNFIDEAERISKLDVKQQQQIADDHALALKLAYEDMEQSTPKARL